jgi:hypothetical protein
MIKNKYIENWEIIDEDIYNKKDLNLEEKKNMNILLKKEELEILLRAEHNYIIKEEKKLSNVEIYPFQEKNIELINFQLFLLNKYGNLYKKIIKEKKNQYMRISKHNIYKLSK